MACWRGFRFPSWARPSIVVISEPRTWTAKARHERAASPIDEHGAGSADPVLATEVRPGQLKIVAEHIGERLPWLDVRGIARPVDDQFDINPVAHLGS